MWVQSWKIHFYSDVNNKRRILDQQQYSCLCRESNEIQSSFSPEELKRAMKKIKEDMSSADRDNKQQVTTWRGRHGYKIQVCHC